MVELISPGSYIQLSDPTVSMRIYQVEGLGACPGAAENCVKRLPGPDATTIPAGGTFGFRLTGRAPRALTVTDATSGALNLSFMRLVGNKYEKLDLSFLDVKLSGGR
jgi:hypothetical protein